MDMVGNVWEWQANFYNENHFPLGLRGGSWNVNEDRAHASVRDINLPNFRNNNIGFRVSVSLPNG